MEILSCAHLLFKENYCKDNLSCQTPVHYTENVETLVTIFASCKYAPSWDIPSGRIILFLAQSNVLRYIFIYQV